MMKNWFLFAPGIYHFFLWELKKDFMNQFFIYQKIYTPLLVIVMCSWVAFWIVRTDAPARCALGITTVLSVTKIGNFTKQ